MVISISLVPFSHQVYNVWLQTRFEISKSYFEQRYPQLQIYLSWRVVLLKHTRFQNEKKNCFKMKKLLTSPNHRTTPAHTALTPLGGGGDWRWVLCKEVPVVVGCKTDPHKAKALVTRLREMGWHPWPTTGAGRWWGPWTQWPTSSAGLSRRLPRFWLRMMRSLDVVTWQPGALPATTAPAAWPGAGTDLAPCGPGRAQTRLCDRGAAPPTDGHHRGPPRPGLDSCTGVKPLWGLKKRLPGPTGPVSGVAPEALGIPGRPPARSPRFHILVQPVQPGATWRQLPELHLQDLTCPEPCAQNPHPAPLPCPSQWQQPVAVITKMTSLVQNFFHEINHCCQSRCHKRYTDSDTLEKGHL